MKTTLLLLLSLLLISCGKQGAVVEGSIAPLAQEQPNEVIPSSASFGSYGDYSSIASNPALMSGPQLFMAASKSYSPSVFNNFSHSFSTGAEFEIPANLPVTSGKPGNHYIYFEYKDIGGEDIRCVYKGNGPTAHFFPACNSANGTKYNFQYCAETDEFNNESCGNNPFKSQCLNLDIGVSSGDTVAASEVSLSVNNGDKCETTEVQYSLGYSPLTAPPSGLNCGDIIEGDITLTSDLDCTSHAGFALAMIGDDNTFNGNGFKIIIPNGKIGILVQGEDTVVEDTIIEAGASTIGIMGYDTKDIEIINNQITNAAIGINIHSDANDLGEVKVLDNSITNSDLYGLYINKSGSEKINKAKIEDNDFSNSGSYAMHLNIKDLEIKGSDNNIINGSENGIYFSGGKLKLKDWDLSSQNIQGTTFMGFQAKEMKVEDVILFGNGGNANQSELGIHNCEVENTYLKDVVFSNMDVGVKVATNNSVEVDLKIKDSEITNMTFAGIMTQSFDGTDFGKLEVKDNDLTSNPVGRGLYEVPVIVYDSYNVSGNSF